jgi:casein kinase II subunit alpha
MARVYADVNQQMPRSYWDYDSVNITWGVLENYEVVRKIGKLKRASSVCAHVLCRMNMMLM